jgi:2-methylisocitrate lyase-like PEP mutase family enzyme
MTRAVDVPFNVDAEDCFADDADGVAETAAMIEATDAAGLSIEDWDPRAATLRPIGVAVERVAAA